MKLLKIWLKVNFIRAFLRLSVLQRHAAVPQHRLVLIMRNRGTADGGLKIFVLK